MGCSIQTPKTKNSSTLSLTGLNTIQQKHYLERKTLRNFFQNRVPHLTSINESSIITRRRFPEKPTNIDAQNQQKLVRVNNQF